MNVIEHCAAKLGPAVKQFLISSMTGESSSNCHIDYHEVIYDLYCCSPQILSGVVPYLTGELLVSEEILILYSGPLYVLGSYCLVISVTYLIMVRFPNAFNCCTPLPC